MVLAELSSIIESAVVERGAALMGVVNTTPDSFFDGGRYLASEAAVARVDAVLDAGATIVYIGGESSRPRSLPVPPAEQIERITPALRHAVNRGALVSVDTTSPEVAEFALREGARIVNDVSCLADPELAAVTARAGAALILTHVRGGMSKMTGFSEWPDGDYPDVVRGVRSDWVRARARAIEAGLPESAVWFDPGFGFAKNAGQSFELLSRLGEFASLVPFIVVGPGRKSFIASVDGAPPEERLGGTIAASLLAVQRGAHIVRVHDVREMRQALAVMQAARPAPKEVRSAL